MSQVEVRQEKQNGQSPAGILLDRNDLAELVFRNRFRPKSQLSAVQISSFRLRTDDSLTQLLNRLEAAERVKIEREYAPRGCYAPATGGNTVVYQLREDETVKAATEQVDSGVLAPLLRFHQTHEDAMEEAIIFPNTSTKGLKGIRLKFNPRMDKLWQTMADLEWAVGRGLHVIALPINAEQFIDLSNNLLERVRQFGLSLEPGTLKYIQFLHDDDGRMFVAIAGGFSHVVRKQVAQQSRMIHKPSAARRLFSEATQSADLARKEIMHQLLEIMGVGVQETETAANIQYINVDLDRAEAVSGGVTSNKGGLSPFTLGSRGMVLHSKAVQPLGAKDLKPTQSLFNTIALNQFVTDLASSPGAFTLHSLALGFHASPRPQKI